MYLTFKILTPFPWRVVLFDSERDNVHQNQLFIYLSVSNYFARIPSPFLPYRMGYPKILVGSADLDFDY